MHHRNNQEGGNLFALDCASHSAWGLKTSSDRKQGKEGGKPTKSETENGFRKRRMMGIQLKKNAQISNETRQNTKDGCL